MVKEYLEKTRDEFLDTKCNLSEKLVSAENHYKENLKIIQMLEESSDTGFEAFSPREVNSYNRSKISELKKHRVVLYSSQRSGYRLAKEYRSMSKQQREEEIEQVKHSLNDCKSRTTQLNKQKRKYIAYLKKAEQIELEEAN